jgi:hypothetical protein
MTDSMDQPNSSPHGGARNLELKIKGILYRLQDLGGRSLPRFLRGGVLKPDYFLRVGSCGPELVFLLNRSMDPPKKTSSAAFSPPVRDGSQPGCPSHAQRTSSEGAPNGRGTGRNVIRGRLRGLWRRYRVTLCILVCMLAVVASFADWWGRSTHATDPTAIARLETRRAVGGEDYLQIGRLINKLVYGGAGTRQNLAPTDEEKDFIEQEIAGLMREFGAEEYSIPPDFVKAMRVFIRQYQERDRDLIALVLGKERPRMNQVRQILRGDHLPEDLAYMALVESRFLQSSLSQEGAAGFWQFTESTAREYGLVVNEQLDERLDLSKSTQAASRYIRDLILDFGAGSSVLLAMAAYNSGPDKVRRAMRNVKDPIKQRNFWYLYSTQALPAETREYVPKVFAAIIIGRNPQRFGF